MNLKDETNTKNINVVALAEAAVICNKQTKNAAQTTWNK